MRNFVIGVGCEVCVIEGLYKIFCICVYIYVVINNVNNNVWLEDFFEYNLIYVEFYSF